MNDVTKQLQNALDAVAANGIPADEPEIMELVSCAGQALGVLKVMGDLNLKEMTYDMVTLATYAGALPDHITNRLNKEVS